MFIQQFCLPHLWLIIFATETAVYVFSWYNIATVLKWQFCLYSDVFQLSLARSKVHMRTWISLIMEYTHHISTSCMPYNIMLCVQVVWSSEWNRLTARCFSDIHTNMERPHPTHICTKAMQETCWIVTQTILHLGCHHNSEISLPYLYKTSFRICLSTVGSLHRSCKAFNHWNPYKSLLAKCVWNNGTWTMTICFNC